MAQAPKAAVEPGAQRQGQDDGSGAGGQNGDPAASKGEGSPEDSKPSADSEGTHPGSATHPTPGTPGHPTPGAKAPAPGVPVTPQGDNSIQTFGTEADESERQEAEANLRGYLAARAEGNWAAACEAASNEFRAGLAKLIEGAKAKPGAEKPEGCAETLELLFGKTPSSTFQQAAQIEQVLSFRIRDDGYAYLIYESQGEIKFIAMADDSGAWKVNTPEPASFQASQGEAQ